ncbi:MAG: hypothetical protein AAFO89_13545, partial [Planctomycetota bacterium]
SGEMDMNTRLKNSFLAAAAVCVCGAAAGQDNQPVFEVNYEGPRGTNTLEAINFGGGLRFKKFIYATAVTNFEGSSDSRDRGQTRIKRGPDSDVGPAPMNAPLATDDPSQIRQFEQVLAGVFQNTNLNNFLDNNTRNPHFSFVLELERPLRDDSEGDDDLVGEIIFFERGAQVANSFILLEALDADGNVMGSPYLINPDSPIEMSPPVQACVLGGANFDYRRSQDLGGVSIDLGKLGVSETSRIRVSRPVVGHDGMEGSMLGGGRDLNPDFKLVFVQTYNVTLTHWAVGD